MTNENSVANRAAPGDFTDVLSKVRPATNPTIQATRPLDNVAFYDFAKYEYLLRTGEARNSSSRISQFGLTYLTSLEQAGISSEQISYVAYFLAELEYYTRMAFRASTLIVDAQQRESIIERLTFLLYGNMHMQIVVIPLFRQFHYEQTMGRGPSYLLLIRRSLRQRAQLYRYEEYGRIGWFWLDWKPTFDFYDYAPYARQHEREHLPEEEYPFEIFGSFSVNVGIRLIYRQEWRPLGIQPGEIVRTIPLGPGQTERVITKIIRRNKRTSTLETVAERETTTESTDTTKDSSEIVREWAEDYKKEGSESGKIGGSIFGIGGEYSDSTTTTENLSDKSKNTGSQLSEAMQKTASKMRSETKVVVSTESEVTFEQENFSEISNPNNEIAITYEYHKLQQQYEVFTYLAEVQSVIFVAEEVPSPNDVKENWVRRHDWVIAKVLKDESYRATLNELTQEVEEIDPTDGLGNDPFAQMLTTAKDKFAQFSHPGSGQGEGLSIPDIYGEPQRIYQQHLKDKVARKRANDIRKFKRNRLFQHIRDNILYYCRAIWANEDSDQRILRYKKENRRVPIEWQSPGLAMLNPNGNQPNLYTPTGSTAPLWELIDPTGPVGFSGNYAVFLLRPMPKRSGPTGDVQVRWRDLLETTVSLSYLLEMMRQPYFGANGELLDPALLDFLEKVKADVHKDPNFLKELSNEEVSLIASYLPQLEDTLFETDDDGNVEFGRHGPIVRRKTGQGLTNELNSPPTADEYAEYLYRKNGTRRFLVDSNNLYLNIRASEGAALEPFKRAHRYIDVLKEHENLTSMIRKNERRATHMQDAGVFDPDIEKVIIVGDGAGSAVAINAALHEAQHEGMRPISPAEQPVSEPTVVSPDGGISPEGSDDDTP